MQRIRPASRQPDTRQANKMSKEMIQHLIDALEKNRNYLTDEIDRLTQELKAMTQEEWKRMNPGLPMPNDDED